MNNELTQQDIYRRLIENPDSAIFYHPTSLTASEVQDMRNRGIIRTGQDQSGYPWARLADSDEADDPQ